MNNDEPIFNIGAVSRMTDIPAATLRIWERRYEFPSSARTDGGHRLYSQHEIDRLRWVKTRTDGGMQIRQAIVALHAQEEERENTSKTIAEEAVSAMPLVEAFEGNPTYLKVLQERLRSTLIEHDLETADQIFDEAMALYTPEDLMLRMIQPTLSQVGQAWSDGNLSIATEHLVSHYLRQRMAVWLRTGPQAFDVAPTILACAPGEYHQGSLLIIGALLRRKRWPVMYLGQSMPLGDVAAISREKEAAAVVFVAMMEEAALALTDLPKWFPNIGKDTLPIISYGGRAFNMQPELHKKVPGLFLGHTIEQGVQTLDSLLQQHLLMSGK